MRGIVMDISTDGRGVIRDGKTVFVKNALPGDEVEYFLVRENKNYDEAEVKRFINYSPRRVSNENALGSAYPLFPLEDDFQMELKKSMVEFNLNRKAGVDCDVIAVPSSSYRLNKLRLHVERDAIGLHERGTNEIYTPDYEILFGHADFIKNLPKNLSGASYVSLRNADNGLFLVTDGVYDGDDLNGVCDANGFRGERPVLNILGIDYKHDIDGFFQNSISGATSALKIIGDEPRGSVLDLYCGVGFISIYVAKNAASVFGVEINDSAIALARENSPYKNTTFEVRDTAKFMRENRKNFDTIIVDPPRSGLVKDVVDGVIRNKNRELVYMSCDLGTFTRDLKILKNYFKIEKVFAIDMFKGTTGVECIAKMTRI